MSEDKLIGMHTISADEARRETLRRLAARGASLEGRGEELGEEDDFDDTEFLVPTPVVETPIVSPPTGMKPDPKISRITNYLSKRVRVSFELVAGIYSVQAIDVIECPAGFLVLFPQESDGASFMPAAGFELGLSWGGKSKRCFSPGITFDMKDLGCIGLVLLLADGSMAGTEE